MPSKVPTNPKLIPLYEAARKLAATRHKMMLWDKAKVGLTAAAEKAAMRGTKAVTQE
jgi:hypothetical protein